MFERSKWDFGVASVTRDGLLYGLGYTPDEVKKPYIAVVNSWNEYNPGHIHLRELADRVKQGIREAGGLPFEVTTTGLCDGMVLKNPNYIEVPSRNLIADEVELNVEANMFDGMVLLSTCDSIVPGHLMAAARCDIPTVMVTGGYMPHCRFRGKEIGLSEVTLKVGKVTKGEYPMEDFIELNQCAHAGQGACGAMTTANSMCCVAEALGLSMPGNATMSATDKRLGGLAYQAGLYVMELVRKGITARHFITERSIENAIMVDMAIAGSTNLLLHIPAIAYEAGLRRNWWDVFDDMSHKIPLLVGIAPNDHRYYFTDFDAAGGSRAMMHNLLPLLHSDCPCINGKTLRENYENAPVYHPEVIHSLDHPISHDGGIAVLHGNLAPDGCIVKAAGIPDNLMTFTGIAKVFHQVDDAIKALRNDELKPGDAIVIRYLGPKGRFGTTAFAFQKELAGTDLFSKVAIITDGRFSGGSHGLSIGYIAPEAAIGGPLAAVQDGDRISIDVKNRTIHLELSDEEIKERLSRVDWVFEASQYKPFLRLFARNVTSTAYGATWE